MSDPALHDVLTPDRLAYLRYRLTGAKRDDNGRPFETNRSRDRWLARHGYLKFGPRPAPVEKSKPEPGFRSRGVREVEGTEKGWEAIRQADAERSAA